jgi:hypothetical protein
MVETYRNFVRKPEGKHKQLGKSASRKDNNIKIHIKEVGLEDVD